MAADRPGTGVWLAVGAVAVVCVGGVVLPRLVGDRSQAESPAVAAQPAGVATVDPDSGAVDGSSPPPGSVGAVAAPSSASWGVPVGFPQSPGGVRAAAVTWVASLGELLSMGPLARNDTLEAVVSQRAYADTVERLRAERDRFVNAFQLDPSQLLWVEAPLAVTIVDAADARAVVEVWSLLLLGSTTTRVDMSYRTHAVTLVWEAGSWRVDAVDRRDGPTPVLADESMPSPGSDFAALAEWTPAVLAGTSTG